MKRKTFILVIFLLGAVSQIKAVQLKYYYYDNNGSVSTETEDVAYTLVVEYSEINTIKDQFKLFFGQQLIREGIITHVSPSRLTDCIFSDFLGYDAMGNISLAQKDFDDYKLISSYYEDGDLKSLDSIVNERKEGLSYNFYSDKNIVSLSEYKNGELAAPYYTLISKDNQLCCNLMYEDNSLYKEPVSYTEAIEYEGNSLLYIANGLYLTLTLSNEPDHYYTIRLKIQNTSTNNIYIDISDIKAWGGSSYNFNQLKVLSAKDYSMSLNKEEIYEKTRDYLSTVYIEPGHSHECFLKISDKKNSSLLAVLIQIDGITYPFYFTSDSSIGLSAINQLIQTKSPNIRLSSATNEYSGNRLLLTDNNVLNNVLQRGLNVVTLVTESLNENINKWESIYSKNQISIATGSRTNKINNGQGDYSQAFATCANKAIEYISNLKKATNSTQVYNICVNYYRMYYQMKKRKKNKEETAVFENIRNSFNSISEQISIKLKCSGDVMKAQIDALGIRK